MCGMALDDLARQATQARSMKTSDMLQGTQGCGWPSTGSRALPIMFSLRIRLLDVSMIEPDGWRSTRLSQTCCIALAQRPTVRTASWSWAPRFSTSSKRRWLTMPPTSLSSYNMSSLR